MEPCPSSADLADFTAARLDPRRLVQVAQHLVGCEKCRALAFNAEALEAVEAVADTAPGDSGKASGGELSVTEEAPGRYRLIRELGRGGQAKVFVAFDHHLGREVAMKVPHLPLNSPPTLQGQTVLRFLREARITARLDHPNIVPIHEIGRRLDGTYYCTQRLIRPSQEAKRVRTLRAALSDAQTPASRLLLLPNFVAVCNAVAHAHSRGVLHRDLKPDNVVIGALGETVVLDWGLGRIQGDTSEGGVPNPQLDDGVVSLVGHVMGTPSYMSPEQALGAHDRVSERSDIWSLGAMLYEILTGSPPFLGATAQQVVTRVKTEPVTPVLTQTPDAPRALAAVAMQALERDPARRYASAEALASDVSAWLANLPVHAYRYSLLEQVRLFAARHKTATGVGLIALVLLGLSSAFVLHSYGQAKSWLAEVFVARARYAEENLQWDAAAAYYAAARAQEDRADARLGAMLAANRAEVHVRRLRGHSGSVLGLARSPDGLTLASASFDRTARLWDVKTGETKRILTGHQRPVTSVTFSPDGRWLVTTSEDGTARRWDLEAGTPGEVLVASKGSFNAAAFNFDGSQLVLGGEDRSVWLVSLGDRAIHRTPPADAGIDALGGPVYGVGFTPDGQKIVSVGWDRKTRFWSADGRFTLLFKRKDHKDAVLSVRFSPNGKEMATGSRDGTVLLYELARLENKDDLPRDGSQREDGGATNDDYLPVPLVGHEQKVYSVDFSPSSQLLASGGTDKATRLWFAGANPRVKGGPNWRALVSASYRGEKEINAVVFTDDRQIASAGEEGDIFLRTFEASFPEDSALRLDSLITLPATGQLVTPFVRGYEVRPLASFDPALATQHALKAPGVAMSALSVSPDQKQLLGVCLVNRLCWQDLEHHTDLEQFEFPADVELTSTHFSADGKWAVVSMVNGPVAIFDAQTRKQVNALPLGPTGVFSVVFSPDSALLATASYDRQIRFWNTTTWQQVRSLEGHEHGVRRVVFSPDGKLLASASWDRRVGIWDVATGRNLAMLRGHLEQASAVAFSPDGKMLASGGWDGMLRLWSVESQQELARFFSDEGRVWSIAFSPDGKSLFYGGMLPHRLEFKPLASAHESLATALKAGAYRLEGPNLVR